MIVQSATLPWVSEPNVPGCFRCLHTAPGCVCRRTWCRSRYRRASAASSASCPWSVSAQHALTSSPRQHTATAQFPSRRITDSQASVIQSIQTQNTCTCTYLLNKLDTSREQSRANHSVQHWRHARIHHANSERSGASVASTNKIYISIWASATQIHFRRMHGFYEKLKVWVMDDC